MTTQTLALPLRHRLLDYVALSKPGIAVMMLFTTFIGFVLAGGRDVTMLVHALIGTALSAAGANALNMFLERDVDARMERTANRPLPSGRMMPIEALLAGIFSSVTGVLYLAVLVNAPCALAAAVTILVYVLAYTPLKRVTSLNTFPGAIAGAIPPLIGWLAACGSLEPGAIAVFMILFFWQFPHFLALAWLHREDYARAGMPMLSVIDATGKTTARQALLYALALAYVTASPWTTQLAGDRFFAPAMTLNLLFIVAALLFLRTPGRDQARRLFVVSLVYLPSLLTLLVWGI